MTFTYHQDPGHGWLAVPFFQLRHLGMTRQDFSKFSYEYRGVAYLEEDCDMPKFMEAWKKRYGSYPELESKHEDPTPIRGYPRLRYPLFGR